MSIILFRRKAPEKQPPETLPVPMRHSIAGLPKGRLRRRLFWGHLAIL